MAIQVMLKLRAKEGKAEEITDLAKIITNSEVRAAEGNIASHVYQDALDPCNLFILDVWESIEAHKAFHNRMMKDFQPVQDQFLEGPLEVFYYRLVK